MEINLIKDLEQISEKHPNRILKIKGYVYEKQKKTFLEIIIYKGFSSSTTHKIDVDLENKVLNIKCSFSTYELFEAPLKDIDDKFIKNSNSFKEISKESFWA